MDLNRNGASVWNTNVLLEEESQGTQSRLPSYIKRSMGFKDPEGFKKAMTDFINAEGDVSTLDKTIQNYYEQQMLSSKQRAGGLEPKSTIPSVKKWERYQEK